MTINRRIIITTLLMSTGWALHASYRSVDSLSSSTRQLHEIEINVSTPRHVLRPSADGSISISAPLLGEQPSFMGGNDPIALLRTLPAVGTNNDLQASLSVRGSGTGANLFESDGVRIINPMHMLGLYSAFNSAFYRTFNFRAGRIPATTSSVTSGAIEAISCLEPDSLTSGAVTLGLIESHGGWHLPVVHGRSSLNIGFRTTYLNSVFPNLLKLGASTLRYSFTDLNASFIAQLSRNDLLRVSLFADRDRMSFNSNKSGTKDGNFGWENLAAGATWLHRQLTTTISASHYSSTFEMSQGGRQLNLPSRFTQLTAKTLLPVGDYTFAADINHRRSSGQNNFGATGSAEASLAATWSKTLREKFAVNLGLRLTAYHCNGFTTVLPLPRVDLTYSPISALHIFANYGRLARFDRLIEESSGNMPIDFWTCATHELRPEQSHNFELGLSGLEPNSHINFMVELYYRILRSNSEFTGSLIDLTNANYNPLSNVILGHGHAKGLSVTAMRQLGKFRARVAYNFGRTKLRFANYGNELFPSVHDRPHDLNVTFSWSTFRNFTLSGSYTYASGTPYTQAKYGYMIGENLICEYFPHNSSRLPTYKRLDLSATYVIASAQRLRHSFNLSVYNALANHNVLMTYTTYSTNEGIRQLQSVMKSIIPSVAYTLSF
jgi:hypothetical protein